jgi:hypothetical protein
LNQSYLSEFEESKLADIFAPQKEAYFPTLHSGFSLPYTYRCLLGSLRCSHIHKIFYDEEVAVLMAPPIFQDLPTRLDWSFYVHRNESVHYLVNVAIK